MKTRSLAILVALAFLGCLTSVAAAGWPMLISGKPFPGVAVGQSYSFIPAATDPNGDKPAVSIQNVPRWADSSSATCALYGTAQAGDEPSHINISISVSDDHMGDTQADFIISVIQVSQSFATLSWIPPTWNTDGSALSETN